jgi:hypothetical protein
MPYDINPFIPLQGCFKYKDFFLKREKKPYKIKTYISIKLFKQDETKD